MLHSAVGGGEACGRLGCAGKGGCVSWDRVRKKALWRFAERSNSVKLSERTRRRLLGFAHYFNVPNPIGWRVIGALSLVGALALAAAWQRPWADSVMTARVWLSTDERGVVAEREVRALFSEGSDRRPVCRVEFDVGRWEGELVRVDIGGRVSRRELPEGETGYVAGAAELVEGEETRPLEFVGWQEGPEAGLHIGPVGPQSLAVEGDPRFAFAMKGGLWQVVRAPGGARVRVLLRPVPTADLGGRPKPLVAARVEEEGGRRWPVRKPDRPPDVFIYLIDTLRADHLGCYGYERGTSPVMDAFAGEATVYERAFTPSTWTRPSVATMLTGLHASVHGAMHESEVLDEWAVLLPEILREAGYGTICISTNDQVGPQAGFEQGYDRFLLTEPPIASWVNKVARNLLETWEPEQPVFMYLHTMEPHEPYNPRPEHFRLFDRGFKGRFDGSVAHMKEVPPVRPGLSEEDYGRLVDLYDAEIFEADQGFALFLDTLRRAGRFENSVIILVSDHGESFGEHDTWGHGWTLNRQEMQVPLVIRFPGGRSAGVRVNGGVSLIDVMPTVLAEVGLRPKLPYELVGRDLSAAAQGGGEGNRRFYGETAFWDSNDLDLVGVIDEDGYKRVIDVSVLPRETATKESIGLWETGADPDEVREVSGERPVRAAYGEQLIARWLVKQRRWREELGAKPPPQVTMTPELRKKLLVLGYLGGPLPRGNREK